MMTVEKGHIVFSFWCGHRATEPFDRALFQSYTLDMSGGDGAFKRCIDCEREGGAD